MTTKAPVSLCMIFRDDPLLEQAVASVRPYVEQVCIVVDDDAPSEAKARTVKVADTWTVSSWRDDFAYTRNISFELATQPYIMWMDTDDVVVGAEHIAREIREANAKLGDRRAAAARLIAPYDYEFDPTTGLVTRQQWRERLVPNDGSWVWEHPTHEGLTKQAGGYDPGLDYWMKDVRWVHKRTETGARSRSLAILEKWYAAGHLDAWTHINLGFELHRAHRYREAEGHFAEHVGFSNWPEEQALACLRAADCAFSADVGRAGLDRARDWVDRAERYAPGAFEVEYARARFAMLRGTLLGEPDAMFDVIAHGFNALAAPETRTPIGRNPADRAFFIHDLIRTAAEVEGEWDTAIRATERALEAVPDHPQLRFALKRYTTAKLCAPAKASRVLPGAGADPKFMAGEAKVSVRVSRSVPSGKATTFRAGEGILSAPVPAPHHDDAYLGKMASALTPDARREMQVRAIAGLPMEPPKTEPGFRPLWKGAPTPIGVATLSGQFRFPSKAFSVAFMCGPAREPWNPDLVERYGHGGSETAVVELARRLGKMGHRVTVYGAPGEEGTFAGDVDYVTWTPDLRPKVDVLVAWRLAPLLAQGEAKARLMWCHDTTAIGMTYEYSLLADRFLALSEWHKGNLVREHGIPESQVFVTRNGVDPALYSPNAVYPPRDRHKAIYCSSPDRGLGALLEMWPAIRSRVPEATLDVYYSFEGWKLQAGESKDQQHRFLVEVIQRSMARMGSFGVRYHGRVPRKKLAAAMCSAGAWLYPTWYPETSCMSAMEARAAGLRIVTSPVGALPETVGDYGRLVEGDWVSAEYQEKFVEAAVGALYFDDPVPGQFRGHTREETREEALRAFRWDGVAEQWDALFEDLMIDAGMGRLPEYREHREVGT